MMRTLLVVVAGLGLLGAVLFFTGPRQETSGPAQTDRTTREVALACDPEMGQVYHVHPVLSIVVNDEPVEIPTNIGVRQSCMTVVHTHSSDGVIHVESPEVRTFTLGDFFAVWEQPFSNEELLTYRTDGLHRIRVHVNGEEVDTYEDTPLSDGAQIEITYELI